MGQRVRERETGSLKKGDDARGGDKDSGRWGLVTGKEGSRQRLLRTCPSRPYLGSGGPET